MKKESEEMPGKCLINGVVESCDHFLCGLEEETIGGLVKEWREMQAPETIKLMKDGKPCNKHKGRANGSCSNCFFLSYGLSEQEREELKRYVHRIDENAKDTEDDRLYICMDDEELIELFKVKDLPQINLRELRLGEEFKTRYYQDLTDLKEKSKLAIEEKQIAIEKKQKETRLDLEERWDWVEEKLNAMKGDGYCIIDHGGDLNKIKIYIDGELVMRIYAAGDDFWGSNKKWCALKDIIKIVKDEIEFHDWELKEEKYGKQERIERLRIENLFLSDLKGLKERENKKEIIK